MCWSRFRGRRERKVGRDRAAGPLVCGPVHNVHSVMADESMALTAGGITTTTITLHSHSHSHRTQQHTSYTHSYAPSTPHRYARAHSHRHNIYRYRYRLHSECRSQTTRRRRPFRSKPRIRVRSSLLRINDLHIGRHIMALRSQIYYHRCVPVPTAMVQTLASPPLFRCAQTEIPAAHLIVEFNR